MRKRLYVLFCLIILYGAASLHAGCPPVVVPPPYMAAIIDAVEANFMHTFAYPVDSGQLHQVLSAQGIDFETLRDPWGQPYNARFSATGKYAVIEITSSGPDRIIGTKDDGKFLRFWDFFSATGREMDSAVADYAHTKDKPVRDLEALDAALQAHSLSLKDLKDPWGKPYLVSFDAVGCCYLIYVRDSQNIVWTVVTPSFELTGKAPASSQFRQEVDTIGNSIKKYAQQAGHIPTTLDELRKALRLGGKNPESFKDPWGKPYQFEFLKTDEYTYAPSVSSYAGAPGSIASLRMSSRGPLNLFGQYDWPESISVAEFPDQADAASSEDEGPHSSSLNEIMGQMIDPQGAVISGAKVTAVNELTHARYTLITGDSGIFDFSRLPPGSYTVRFQAEGFNSAVIKAVPAAEPTRFDVHLNVGRGSTTIEMCDAVS